MDTARRVRSRAGRAPAAAVLLAAARERLLEATAETERCLCGRRRVQTLGLGLVLGRIKAAAANRLLSLARARSRLVRPVGTHWLMNFARFSRRRSTRSSLVRICAAAPRHAGSLRSRRGGTRLRGFRARGHLLMTLVAPRRAGVCLGMGSGESKRSGR